MIAQLDPIRVYVDVPEIYAPAVRAGLTATIELPSFPGQRFSGKVARTADAIDPATRTLRTEIDVPNRDGKLFPGSYAQVHFGVNVTTAAHVGPGQCAVVPRGRPACRGRRQRWQGAPEAGDHWSDYGTEVEILGGLDPSESIVLNPSDSLEEGQTGHMWRRKASTHEVALF